uniref:Uncharacterized protein n=1 Tax=Octopus bimaculoides TaxID=37653 RepID=A0A0L8H6E9_OCTBM
MYSSFHLSTSDLTIKTIASSQQIMKFVITALTLLDIFRYISLFCAQIVFRI